jgi:outer membrane protein assembly factor BamE (lipoprotein component of BamABCDE complex)
LKSLVRARCHAAVLLFSFTVMAAVAGCATDAGQYFLTPGLTEAQAQSVTIGMPASEVEAKLGKPYQRIRFDNLKATAWDYRYVDTWGYVVEFAVMIGDDGRVTGKVVARIDPQS